MKVMVAWSQEGTRSDESGSEGGEETASDFPPERSGSRQERLLCENATLSAQQRDRQRAASRPWEQGAAGVFGAPEAG